MINHVVWSKLKLTPIFDLIDKKGVQAHALQSRVKYVRIVRRQVKTRNRFYVQLILEGVPEPKQNYAKDGIVGLDLGPSSIAAVGNDTAFLKGFCEETPLRFALSQICHCGNRKKKSLSIRWHKCQCGAVAQRDLYSAFLARFADAETFDIILARKAWTGAEPLLTEAVSKCNQAAKGKLRLSSFGLGKIPRQSCSLGESNKELHDKAWDVVPSGQTPGRALENCAT